MKRLYLRLRRPFELTWEEHMFYNDTITSLILMDRIKDALRVKRVWHFRRSWPVLSWWLLLLLQWSLIGFGRKRLR